MESADQPGEAFRLAMRRLASTVSVITCSVDGVWRGITATAVSPVCIEPPALLVCINRASPTHEGVRRSGAYCINLLYHHQSDISRAFGGQAPDLPRFESGQWLVNDAGIPYLADGQASLFCELDRQLDYGTHTIFVGRVTATVIAEKVAPLIYQDGSYVRAAAGA